MMNKAAMGDINAINSVNTLAALISHLCLPSGAYDPDEGRILVNDAWCEAFDRNLSAGEWLSLDVNDALREPLDELAEQLRDNGGYHHVECELHDNKRVFLGWKLTIGRQTFIRFTKIKANFFSGIGSLISPQPVLLVENNGKLRSANCAAEQLALEMGLASPLDLTHPRDQRALVGEDGPQFNSDNTRTVHYGQRFFQWQYITLDTSGCLVLFGQEHTREESYRRALEHAVHGIIELNAEGTITNVNEETASLFNYGSVRELTQSYLRHPETFYANDSDRIQLRRDLATGKGVHARDIEMRRADGSQVWVRLNATEIRGEGGILLGYSVTMTDITKNRQAEYDLRRRQERYRALVQTAGSVIMFLDAEGRILEYNRECEWTFGYSWMEAAGQNFFDFLLVEDDRARVRMAVRRLLSGEIIKDEVFSFKRRDGEVRLLQWNARAHFGEDGDVAGVICIGQDVTEKLSVERALRHAEEKFRGIFENSAEGLFQSMPLGPVHSANPAFASILGYETVEDLLAKEQDWSFHYLNPVSRLRITGRLLRDGSVHGFETEMRRADGKIIWVEENARLVRDEQGRPVLIDGSITDITDRKRSEARIQFLAHHDGLTGLPNRTLFQERLAAAVERSKRERCHFVLMMFDLDNFKDINDTLGHPIGDLLLQGVGERMRVCLRNEDVVARLGGDEFAVLIHEPGSIEEVTFVAQRLIERVSERFMLDGNEVQASTSVGICMYPQDGRDEKDLLRNADLALYCSKAEGRNRYHFFEPKLQVEVQERKAMERDLSHAIENDELELFYQPIIDIGGQRIIGMEALVRWFNPSRGQVSPVDFIPVAERMGIIADIGKWVLKRACEQTKAWRDAGFGELTISVNLSPLELARHEDLIESVGEVLSRTELDPHQLQFEVTEGAVMDNPREAAITLGILRNQGIRIAIDDFGTGYSSLAYLKRFPVDKIKIDRSFIIDIDSSDGNAAIVRAVVFLARSFGMAINVEGIETKTQLEHIASEGVDEVQGFYFSRPISATEMEALLKENLSLPVRFPVAQT
ncbi:sensor domain-containing protein [Thalassospira tepidiphila]|jgi:diguanylate cyclase (GGDEF)-like protein/PAS domain S-box-containing protein|uniref:sensor domain-containing protein n=1 Tax=Thalassospira tepidiphila TaxID=393657 RepID=UPI00201B5255|nr:EAL domain-containing protein [Thalassospira tepidiphila]